MPGKYFALTLALCLWPLAAFAQDDALSAKDSVPMGERLAVYLQSYFNTFSSLEALKPGEKGSADPLKASIFYNPQGQLITVLIVGSLSDPEAAKPVLTTAQKVLMQAAKSVKDGYGFALSEKDFGLIYFSAGTRKSILTLKGGVWAEPAFADKPAAAADTPTVSGTAAVTPVPAETKTPGKDASISVQSEVVLNAGRIR